MLIGDELAAALPELREQANSRMRDTCRITKPGSGKGTFNEATGKYDAPDPVDVYVGPCRIPTLSGTVTDAQAGEATWAVGEYPLAVPITDPTTADIAPGMTVEYLTAEHDPSLAGRKFGIVKPIRKTSPRDRRFKMKEAVG